MLNFCIKNIFARTYYKQVLYIDFLFLTKLGFIVESCTIIYLYYYEHIVISIKVLNFLTNFDYNYRSNFSLSGLRTKVSFLTILSSCTFLLY